jgi:hypothetical protein
MVASHLSTCTSFVGSANVRMGFASQDVPFNIPHCIVRCINPQEGKEQKFSVRDQVMQIRGRPSYSVCCILAL